MTVEELRGQLAELRGVIAREDVPAIAKETLEVKVQSVGKQLADAEFEAQGTQRAALNLKVIDYFKSNKILNGLLDEAIALGAIGISYKEYKDENGVATRNPALIFAVADKPATQRKAKAPKDPNAPKASKLYKNVATGQIQRLDGVYQDFATAEERAGYAAVDKSRADYNSYTWREFKNPVLQRVLTEGKVVHA